MGKTAKEQEMARALYGALEEAAIGDAFMGEFRAGGSVTIDGHFDLLVAVRSMSRSQILPDHEPPEV